MDLCHQVIFRKTLIPLTESGSTVVDELSPCITYSVEVIDLNKNISYLSKEFR